jgi:hypothetical protein
MHSSKNEHRSLIKQRLKHSQSPIIEKPKMPQSVM